MIREGTTERLILRPLEIADAEQIQALFPHWEIVSFLMNRVPWPYPADGALRFIQDVALPQQERGEAWHWTLRLRTEPSQIIGVINLAVGETNRGFWLAPEWQGQGLMSEACCMGQRLLVRYAPFPASPRCQSHRKHRFAPHLREARHAHGRSGKSRLCLRPASIGAMGDHRGGMARMEESQPKACVTSANAGKSGERLSCNSKGRDTIAC